MQRYASHLTATAATLLATVTLQAADVLIESIIRHDCGLTNLYLTAIFDPAFLALRRRSAPVQRASEQPGPVAPP